MVEKRFFTLDEARRELVRIRPLVARMVETAGRLEAYRDYVQSYSSVEGGNGGGAEGTAYLETLLSLQRLVEEIQESGCLIKGVQEGLLDFPHLREGREVCLCWKHGETDIRFWHEVDAGFAGRKPLSD